MRHGLVLTAAGASTRFGGESKVLVALAGIPVLVRAAAPFRAVLSDLDVVLTVSAADRAAVETLVQATPALAGARIVVGGGTRAESVRRGVAALDPTVEWVLVHDAARPCVSPSLIARVLAAAEQAGAAAPGLPVADTIHRVDDDALVVESPRRGALRAVQTPQIARRDLLRRAYLHAAAFALEATDEVGLLTAAGIPVRVVPGDPANEKVTTRDDLDRIAGPLRRGGRDAR